MSDHQPQPDAPPPPEPADEPPPPPPPPARRRGAAEPLVLALGAVVIALVVAFLVLFPFGSGSQGPSSAEQVAALQTNVQSLAARVRDLASRPAGQPAKLAALSRQVTALQHAPQAATPDLAPIEQRVASLEQKVRQGARPTAAAPDLQPVERRLSALEQQVAQLKTAAAQPQHTAQDLAPLRAQLGKLAAAQQRLESQVAQGGDMQAAVKAFAARLDRQQQALAKLTADLRTVSADSGQAVRAARVEAALTALDAGRPLGAVPDAPPEVARFAKQAPPTLYRLRTEFPDVAKAVLAASRPAEGQKFLTRLWTNAQDLVTVRRGDRVLVGDPAAGVVAHARDDLDHGDLRDAVQALSQLQGPAAQAASGWLGSARAVLAARTALLGMAGAA